MDRDTTEDDSAPANGTRASFPPEYIAHVPTNLEDEGTDRTLDTSEDDSAQSGNRASCPPGYIAHLLTNLVDDATDPTVATSEDDSTQSGTRKSYIPRYLYDIIPRGLSASYDMMQDPFLYDGHDKSTVGIVEHTDLTEEGPTCIDQSGDSTEADSNNEYESMTRDQNTTSEVCVENNSNDDELTESEITDTAVDNSQRDESNNSTCEMLSDVFDNSAESPSIISVDQDEETCTEVIESSIDDGVMSPTLSIVSKDDERKIHVESLQERNTTETSGAGSSCYLHEQSDSGELLECQKIQTKTSVENLGCCNENAESVDKIHTEEDLNVAKVDTVLKSLELQNIEPQTSVTLSNSPSKSNIVENVSESLLKPARKSATSIKNIIDAFECKPLKDSIQVKLIRNIDTDKVESIEGIISQIDSDSCNNSMTTVKQRRQPHCKVLENVKVLKKRPSDEQASQLTETCNTQETVLPIDSESCRNAISTRQALNRVSDVTVLKKRPSDEQASQLTEACNTQELVLPIDSESCRNAISTRQALNQVSDVTVLKRPSDEEVSRTTETNNFKELALPSYQILQTKSEEEMCLAVSSHNDEQKALQVQNTTDDKNNEKEPIPRGTKATGVRSQNCFMVDLIYWSDPKMTASVFGVVLAMLGVLCTCSIISIVAWLGLAMIAAGTVQRVFSQTKTRQRRSNKLDDFIKAFSDKNVRESTDLLVAFIHLWFTRMRKIFLVDNIANTLQVAVMCYVLTYVGSWFNGVTVASILLTALFTLPKLYDIYERQIQGAVARLVNKWKQLAARAKRVEAVTEGEKINVGELF